MSRNRKAQSAAIRFKPVVKAVLLCLLIGGSGVGYVWQKDQLDGLGKQIKSREVHLKHMVDHNERLQRQLADMRGYKYLEMKIQELKLGLVPPQPGQVWYLAEPGAEAPSTPTERQYAARNGSPLELP